METLEPRHSSKLLDRMRRGSKPRPAEDKKPRWAGAGFTVDDLLDLHARQDIKIRV